MRFDDSLRTVLAADASTAFGASAAFRQLVDLVARGRVAPDDTIMGRLQMLRGVVPAEVRESAARGLATGRAPAALVALFAQDEPPVSRTALRTAQLDSEGWITLLPAVGPAGRAVLRRRSDLDPDVVRALESFGSTDFALSYDAPVAPEARVDAAPLNFPAAPPQGKGPFTPVGALADALPIVAEARRRVAEAADAAPATAVPPPPVPPVPAAPPTPAPAGGFQIADLAHRIAAFQRERQASTPVPAESPAPGSFAFETDAAGTIRWADVQPRAAIVGLSIATAQTGASEGVDGAAAGAFGRRTAFADARLTIGGGSSLAGAWRISGVPLFDRATGRFAGFRGAARRPRADESAARPAAGSGAEGLRRLVHELRTPVNAIAGFSELIESELLGPVAPPYRERATAIRTCAADLLAAIEDLDMAARIEGDALELRAAELPMAPLLARVAAELAPLARLRSAELVVEPADPALAVACDDRATERLVARLAAALVSAAQPGERIAIAAGADAEAAVSLAFTRPRTLAHVPDADLLTLDAEQEADLPGAPLLGTGFALRLARNLAGELGGSLTLDPLRLTLRLPAAVAAGLEQASKR